MYPLPQASGVLVSPGTDLALAVIGFLVVWAATACAAGWLFERALVAWAETWSVVGRIGDPLLPAALAAFPVLPPETLRPPSAADTRAHHAHLADVQARIRAVLEEASRAQDAEVEQAWDRALASRHDDRKP